MFGQVTLVQHSASHIDHGISHEVVSSHDSHHDDQDNSQHECPECSLAQSLQVAFFNQFIAVPFGFQSDALPTIEQSYVIAYDQYKANSPRAPPSILI